MNQIFYALVAIAFAVATWRQITWVEPPPAPAPVEEVAPAPTPAVPGGDASLEGQLAGLAQRVAKLEKPPAKPADPKPQPIEEFTNGLFDGAKTAVMTVVLPLIGAMAFFLGLMKVAEAAGMMQIIAKLLRPIMVKLFPDVPPNHPAMGAMILNMSANALGLGNAATPFGIKAMQELDKLNASKGTATNAMCLFLAINTSSITLLPTGVIAIRKTLGSTDAAGILPTTLMASLVATGCAIVFAKVFQRFYPLPVGTGEIDDKEEEAMAGYPLWVSVVAMLTLVAMIPLTVLYGQVFGKWIIPAIVFGFLTYGFLKKVKVYEVFISGAKEGFDTGVRIIPFIVAILAAIGMLRGSGAIDAFVNLVGDFTLKVGMPAEALPMALLRSLSGSGAYGVMVATMEEHGPDTYIGYLVSTLQGSSETTFYVLAVYFGAVGVQKIRHAAIAALLADIVAIAASVLACYLYFRFNGLQLPF